MKYDDASWHHGGDFPKGLSHDAAATHIALLLAWAASAGLIGALHIDEFPDCLARLVDRSITPGSWFITACDAKFTDEDLNAEGNAFATVYYLESEAKQSGPKYLDDYFAVFPEYDAYRIPDDWESFERLKPVLDRRLSDWRQTAT